MTFEPQPESDISKSDIGDGPKAPALAENASRPSAPASSGTSAVRRKPRRLLPALLVVLGLLWIGQGQNLIKGSMMTDSSLWSIAGVGMLLLALLYVVYDRRQRQKG